jgi:hypothetical protein
MYSNTSSLPVAEGLTELAAAVDALAAQDLTLVPDAQAATWVLVLRTLLERLQGQWLRALAAVDGRGAGGAEDDTPVPSTAGWLRHRLRLGGAAAGWVRVARALAAGELSAAHAAVLAGAPTTRRPSRREPRSVA